jgi:hypothetical protein
MQLGSNEAIKHAIVGGLGIAVLSLHSLTCSRAAAAGLALLDVQGFPIMRRWHLVYPRNRELSLVARTFLDFAIEYEPEIRAAAGRGRGRVRTQDPRGLEAERGASPSTAGMTQPWSDDRYPYPVARIGIIGGGQLGRMLVGGQALGCTCACSTRRRTRPRGSSPAADRRQLSRPGRAARAGRGLRRDHLRHRGHRRRDPRRAGPRGPSHLPVPGLLADIQDKLTPEARAGRCRHPHVRISRRRRARRRAVRPLRLSAGAEGPPRRLRRSRRAGHARAGRLRPGTCRCRR